jgi:hypothetical protein
VRGDHGQQRRRDVQDFRGVEVDHRGGLPAVDLADRDHPFHHGPEPAPVDERGGQVGRPVGQAGDAYPGLEQVRDRRYRVGEGGQVGESGHDVLDLLVADRVAGQRAQTGLGDGGEGGEVPGGRQRHAVAHRPGVPGFEQVGRLAEVGEPAAQRLERHQGPDHVEGDGDRAACHDRSRSRSASSMAR